MKKIVTLIVASILLVCMVLPLAVSAEVLWTEDFSQMNENDWIWDGDLFTIENGKLEGWAEAVVHQSNFLVDRGAPRRFKECCFKVDAAGFEDGGRDADDHYLGLWFADYVSPNGADEPDGQIVYTYGYRFEEHKVVLNVGFDNAGEDYKPADFDDTKPIAEYVVPESDAPELDPSGTDAFSIGMRVSGGVISCFFNDQKVIEFNAYRGATTCTQLGSPVILWNTNCHCTFDNLVVATADHDLFNEGAAINDPAPAQTEAPANNDTDAEAPAGNDAATEKVVEKENVVVGTDADGSAITEVVTKEVVRPAANTGAKTTGGSAAKTGDAAIIVAFVMVAALGCAVVVKKIGSK